MAVQLEFQAQSWGQGIPLQHNIQLKSQPRIKPTTEYSCLQYTHLRPHLRHIRVSGLPSVCSSTCSCGPPHDPLDAHTRTHTRTHTRLSHTRVECTWARPKAFGFLLALKSRSVASWFPSSTKRILDKRGRSFQRRPKLIPAIETANTRARKRLRSEWAAGSTCDHNHDISLICRRRH